jgi:hypothetical protein
MLSPSRATEIDKGFAPWSPDPPICRTRRGSAMWFLVSVVRGNRYFEPESQVDNHVLISDTSDIVISARSSGADGCRFEARKGNETFVVSDFPKELPKGALLTKFMALAQQMGAVTVGAA